MCNYRKKEMNNSLLFVQRIYSKYVLNYLLKCLFTNCKCFTYVLDILSDRTISLRWYGTSGDSNVAKSILQSKYPHVFRIFEFYNIFLKLRITFF